MVIKNVKLVVEIIVDIEDWGNSIKEDYYEDNKKYPSKQYVLDKIKEEFQDLETISNHMNEFKVINIKETKQTKFKY